MIVIHSLGGGPLDRTPHIGRYASMLYRLGNRYYDRILAENGIGCGQQFFLLRLHENPGLGVKDLAKLGIFDKGTAARALQKLEELGYLRRDEDPRDKRAQRLYATEQAAEVVAATQAAVDRWNAVLTEGMTEAEAAEAWRLMAQMADNALGYFEREEWEHDTKERD